MGKKIILSADSPCDLGDELKKRYDVTFFPYHIILDGKQYSDSVDIWPDDIYAAYRQKGILPKTSAINISEYVDYFKQWTDQGYEVIHFNLGAALSSSYQNCIAAADELEGVYPINSCSLSTGMSLQLIEAAELIKKGMPAAEIAKEAASLNTRCHANFILDTLEFMRAGGRCSTIAALGANLLKLKPCIEVDNKSGAMGMGKLYRGSLDKVLVQYAEEQLARYPNIKRDRAFITHSGISEERIEMIRGVLTSRSAFDEIYITRASCTISSHCGPNTLGVLFMTE
jgi:DegV family protein with EDD domain